MECSVCGRWAPNDPETGYSASGLCPFCQADGFTEALVDGKVQIINEREPQPCEACGGSGTVPIGEHHVTRDMALDAGEPAMEGMSCGPEMGPCDVCGGSGLTEREPEPVSEMDQIRR